MLISEKENKVLVAKEKTEKQEKKNIKKSTSKKNSEIKKEKERILKFLLNKKIDTDKLNIAIELINDIAFMTVESNYLRKEVHEFGTTEEYQNGANQKGRKKSASFDAYLNLTKQKAALIKQLTDLLPIEENGDYIPPTDDEEKDELDKFLEYREKKNESNT